MTLPRPVYPPRSGLDAVVVTAPVDDTLLDGFGLEVLGEGLADERGELVVGGEAEGDELFDGELIDVGSFLGWEKGVEAEALFEADDAVLDDHGAVAATASNHE